MTRCVSLLSLLLALGLPIQPRFVASFHRVAVPRTSPIASVSDISSRVITRVEIQSSWTGLSPTAIPTSIVTIVKNDNGYFAGPTRVDDPLIARLDRDLGQTPIASLSLTSLSVTPAWLRANAPQALVDLSRADEEFRTHSASQTRLFLSAFSNIQTAASALHEYYYEELWTDDYPDVSVVVKYSDGTSTSVDSSAQQLYMMPWKEQIASGPTFATYNPDLGVAIGDLLPETAANRSRLDPGDDFLATLADRVALQLKDQWALAGAADTLGAQLDPIEKVFTISKSAIYQLYSSNSLDNASVWDAQLRSRELPHNIAIHVDLPVQDSTLSNTASFLDRIPEIVKRAMSVTWIARYMARHPSSTAEITYTIDRSLSSKAQNSIEDELISNGFGRLLRTAQAELDKSVLVQISENDKRDDFSEWVILPNGSSFPWYLEGTSAAGFNEARLNCVLDSYYYCGSLILPDGEITAVK
jgi:hypothetical protein